MRQITDPIIAGLLEAAPDATVCVDESGRIVLVNAQAERLFGYPREELADQPVEILVPDAIKARYTVLRTGYAADRITGCAGDGAVWPVVDLLAQTLPEVTEVASGEQTGSGPTRPHIYLTAFREPGARALARAAARVIAQDPPERRHAVTDVCPAAQPSASLPVPVQAQSRRLAHHRVTMLTLTDCYIPGTVAVVLLPPWILWIRLPMAPGTRQKVPLHWRPTGTVSWQRLTAQAGELATYVRRVCPGVRANRAGDPPRRQQHNPGQRVQLGPRAWSVAMSARRTCSTTAAWLSAGRVASAAARWLARRSSRKTPATQPEKSWRGQW